MLVAVVIFLTIIGEVSRVSAVTCYQCESYRDWRCSDPFDSRWFVQVEYIFIALYYKQLSADIKMKNYTIKTSFVSPEGPMARAKNPVKILYLCYYIFLSVR